jgi:hypothetical protein
MATSTQPSSVLAWAGAALLTIVVLRVIFLFVSGGEESDAQWRRRWVEVGALVVGSVSLLLIAVWVR